MTLPQAVEKLSQVVPPTPEPSPPPSGNPGSYNQVRIFNLEGNDEGRVYLNDELILTGHAGEEANVSVGEGSEHPLRTDRRNEFRFELLNNGGGYTYGFELSGNGRPVYLDVQGTPDVKNAALPNGQEDQTQGIVYNERLVVNNKVSPVGSGPFWVKVFNQNADEALTVNVYNEANDPTWPSEGMRVQGTQGTISRALPLKPFNQIGGEVLTSGDPVENEKRVKYMSLFANAVMLRNVVDLTEAVNHMLQAGKPVTAPMVQRLSPYKTEHIRRFGHYILNLAQEPPPLNPDQFALPTL